MHCCRVLFCRFYDATVLCCVSHCHMTGCTALFYWAGDQLHYNIILDTAMVLHMTGCTALFYWAGDLLHYNIMLYTAMVLHRTGCTALFYWAGDLLYYNIMVDVSYTAPWCCISCVDMHYYK